MMNKQMNKSLKVLIVEDSDCDARLLLNELKRGGYEPLAKRVETRQTMENALEKQEWDIVIADYVMPCFSGVDALKLVQDRMLDLPFIIVSGNIDDDVAVSAMKAGAQDYLHKNNLARLNAAIERELRQAETRRERRQAEQALKESEEQYRQQYLQSQKMEAVGQMAASIAHEINNRLTVVLGHLDLCLGDVKQKSTLYQTLLMIQKNIKLTGRLNNKLLLFGQRQAQYKAPINLNQNIREIRDMLKRRLNDYKISFDLCLSRNLWKVYADSSNMDEVIINLILNARDSMPNGGSMAIKTENFYLQQTKGREAERAGNDRYVRFSVSDTGAGMEEPVLSHIFEPFFTTKEGGQGTGLGLSVVYGIVRSHDGWIDVSSHPGQGSTFKIILPAIKKKQISVIPSQHVYDCFDSQEEKILLVEDDPEVLSLTKKVLKRNGYLVYPCKTVSEALAIFEQESRCFDLVLCDVILPDGNGAELVMKLKEMRPLMGALLVGGYVHGQVDWLQLKDISFMRKPYTFSDLLRQVHMQCLKNKV
jgi:two-component system cell cycle sensor histidine kinase/response regulator CckA